MSRTCSTQFYAIDLWRRGFIFLDHFFFFGDGGRGFNTRSFIILRKIFTQVVNIFEIHVFCSEIPTMQGGHSYKKLRVFLNRISL